MICGRCGSEAPDGARFCPACGNELLGGTGQQERKLVSVLFVDVVGSTARADGADPEDVRDRNQLYFQDARERIERHGGIVEKYIGDAVMAVFGAPLARVDDAERAVRAGLSILEGIAQLNAANEGLDLEVRGAVCTGEAVIAVEPAPGEALATGDVVNTAARLQNAAAPGGILVGEETHRLTRHAFRFEPIPAVDAKGKAAPVAAWSVLEPLEAPGSRPTSDTPLAGRERELDLLSSIWDRAVEDGRPHMVTILGPAGIGKSRMAREASERIERAGGRSLWGRSLPYEEQTPYRAAGEMVRHVAGIYENDPVDVARTKLEVTLDELFPPAEVADATRYLSLVLGLGLDAPPDEAIHLLFTVRMLVEQLAERQPVLLVFEDVHWGDDALLDAIDYLVSHVRDARLVVLALARPEFIEAGRTWGGGMVGHTTLPLEPLTGDDSKAVATALLPGADASTIERIVSVAEGNPLFLEELGASVADAVSSDELPSTVWAAIAGRIDALPPDARAALLHASVIGQDFWRGVLDGMGELGAVDDALEALESRGLILRRSQSQVEGDVEFAFKHVLIRDVAYGTLPRGSRRDLHAAIARFLEETLTDPADLGWLLAHHWREAGEVDAARGYLLGAAERARDALAVEETYDLFTRALDLATTDEDRRRIRLRRGLALTELEDYARADVELAELLPELSGVEEIEALLARSRATLWTEKTAETFSLAGRAVELVRARGPAELEAVAVARLSQAHGMRGDEGDIDQAIDLGDRALRLWPGNDRLLELAEAYHMQADVYYWTGSFERARELSTQAAATGGLEPRGAEFLLRGGGMEGLILAGMGRYEEALAAGDLAIETARKLGRKDNVVLNYSTAALREVFALDEARLRSETVTDRLGPSSFNMPWINARADLLGAQLLMEDLATVDGTWPALWDDAVESEAWERWLVSGRLAANRAELDLALGRTDDAVTWSRRALELATRVNRRKYVVSARTTLGRALVARGDAEGATGELQSAVSLADELGSPLLRWQSRAALAVAERGVKRVTSRAEAHAREAAEIIESVAAGLSPERARTYLAASPVVEALDLTR
ncbi:MAG TPA: AAA family ATPase [Actinomycetota bacterium]|nr:AAA family ATPase [Actinomycetota bacterium]